MHSVAKAAMHGAAIHTAIFSGHGLKAGTAISYVRKTVETAPIAAVPIIVSATRRDRFIGFFR